MSTHKEEPLDLLILGAGVYGVCAASTYLDLHPTHSVLVLDSDSDVGGVWSRSRLYPSFWSQTGIRLCGYPDKPFIPPEEAEHYHGLIEAKWVAQYLEDYVSEKQIGEGGGKLRERFKFGVWVKSVRKESDGMWSMEAEEAGEGARVYRARKVIIATGLSSLPNMPDLPGKENFKGTILHQKDFGRSRIFTHEEADVQKHTHITVLGGSKSAADIAYAAAKDPHHPRSVSWIVRTNGRGALALISVKSPLKKYRNITESGSTRGLACLSAANPYLPAHSWREFILYGTTLGEWILNTVWQRPDAEYMADADFDGREGKLEGYESLKANGNIRWRVGHVGLLQRDDFWDVIARKVQVYRDEVVGLESEAVVLADGTKVKTDVLLCATGWKHDTPMFEAAEAARLGLPVSLDETGLVEQQKQHWAMLDEEADKRVLARWPFLQKLPEKFKSSPFSITPYRLYNHTLPISDPSIAFLGTPLVPNAYHTAISQTLYAIAALDGTLSLPPKEEMEADVAFTNAWCRRRYPVHGYTGNVLEYEMPSKESEGEADMAGLVGGPF